MSIAHVVVTIVAAAWVAFSAVSMYRKAKWVVEPLADYGVPESWWSWLAAAKTAGCVGLLVGLAVPAIGIAAAAGLVLYFLGAVVTIVRARSYSHIPYPLMYLVPVAAAAALGAAA
ncbi:DoxX family protein [Nocardia sp. NBC_01503]|uniref:DoxX family protein n=1 Tax=Nocardia sp. NBC_01503 TaxID=2975997 RepID=UPI002E7B553F|nr:DoxX family protein [Nocardia sp. NBC_01503]WTL33226.1 DoxX family protein [Nocardia sp. NBC_01503]